MLKFLERFRDPAKSKAIKDCFFVVLDTELTGLDVKRDEILSLGAIKMRGSQILLGEIFYREVYVSRFSKETVAIHKILPSEIEDSPEISKILPEFLEFIKDSVLVGYHTKIDLTFIKKYFRKFNLMFPRITSVDVYRVYQWLKKKA